MCKNVFALTEKNDLSLALGKDDLDSGGCGNWPMKLALSYMDKWQHLLDKWIYISPSQTCIWVLPRNAKAQKKAGKKFFLKTTLPPTRN